jgi:hypothetical protein
MRWRVEPGARYRISEDARASREIVADAEGILAFALEATPGNAVGVRIAGPIR